MRHRQCAAAMAIGLIALLGVSGCPFMPDQDNNGGPPPPPAFLARTSPENLLNNLKSAYKQRAAAEFESLLAQNFTFVLSADDANKPGMDPQWGRDVEVRAHQRMFDNTYVITLTLDFVVGPRQWDAAEGMYTILISNVNLYLHGSTPSHPGDPKEYRVENSNCKFWFVQKGWTDASNGLPVWTIVKWEDNPAGG